MKIEVIYNNEWPDDAKIHLRVDGAVNEECNTDQMENKVIKPLSKFLVDGIDGLEESELCERCFER